VESLRKSGLAETIMGRAWIAEGGRASHTAPLVTVPFREAGFFREAEVRALSVRFSARRGEAITTTLTLDGASRSTRVFLDLYALPDASDSARAAEVAPPRRVASADSGSTRLLFEAPRDGVYLLRVQPELLGGGRYTLTVERGPSLAFPVLGKDSRAVLSFWGAERDGGQRDHQGVDIFARRGTPVTAAARGLISNTGVTGLGGKVVWLRDTRRGQSLYYAHLDSQIVRAGQSVDIGDTLGLLGNTGNARTTSPHLHFGIYRRGEGAIDPFPFIQRSPGPPPAIAADTAALGSLARVRVAGAVLRRSPEDRAARLTSLVRETVVEVNGVTGGWYRVAVPGDSLTNGFVPAGDIEVAARPLRSVRVAAGNYLRAAPTMAASPVDTVATGNVVPLLGRAASSPFVLVRNAQGGAAWMPLWP
jgi:murein DD-endopeptidase MepM/ murein hydrolase activator NlpD